MARTDPRGLCAATHLRCVTQPAHGARPSQETRAMKKNLTRMLITTAVLAATASTAQAAGPRPDFQMPFSCAQQWAASTYDGHWPDQDSIDLGEWNGSTNISERE